MFKGMRKHAFGVAAAAASFCNSDLGLFPWSVHDPVSDIGFLIETSCGTSRPLSALRSHEAMGMLGRQDVMMQVSYPLSAGNRHI
jgi:hypothetical protein